MKAEILAVVVMWAFLLISYAPMLFVAAIEIPSSGLVETLVTLEEWFPLPLTRETTIMWLIILVVSMAGGTFGIAMKHYQEGNHGFNRSDLTYYAMIGSLSIFFLISATPVEQCFIYSTSINGGLGILRNMYEQRSHNNNDTVVEVQK